MSGELTKVIARAIVLATPATPVDRAFSVIAALRAAGYVIAEPGAVVLPKPGTPEWERICRIGRITARLKAEGLSSRALRESYAEIAGAAVESALRAAAERTPECEEG